MTGNIESAVRGYEQTLAECRKQADALLQSEESHFRAGRVAQAKSTRRERMAVCSEIQQAGRDLEGIIGPEPSHKARSLAEALRSGDRPPESDDNLTSIVYRCQDELARLGNARDSGDDQKVAALADRLDAIAASHESATKNAHTSILRAATRAAEAESLMKLHRSVSEAVEGDSSIDVSQDPVCRAARANYRKSIEIRRSLKP